MRKKMTEKKQTTLGEIKLALDLLKDDAPFPCICEDLKQETGICLKHNKIFISHDQVKLLRMYRK